MIAIALLLTFFALGGCRTGARPDADATQAQSSSGSDPSASAVITNTDACASRLHEFSGALLLYYFFSGDLPLTLDELVAVDPEGQLPEGICPVSGLAYIYRPEGLLLAERGEQVILHDPAASHSGIRWAVTLGEEDEFANRVTKVIALPERFFLLQRSIPPQPEGENQPSDEN